LLRIRIFFVAFLELDEIIRFVFLEELEMKKGTE